MSKQAMDMSEIALGLYEHQFLPGLGKSIAQAYANLGVQSCSGSWAGDMPYDCESLVTWTAISGLFILVSSLLVLAFRIDARTICSDR